MQRNTLWKEPEDEGGEDEMLNMIRNRRAFGERALQTLEEIEERVEHRMALKQPGHISPSVKIKR